MSIDFTGYEPEDVLRALINVAVIDDFYKRLPTPEGDYALSLIQRKTIEYVNGCYLGVTFAKFPLMDSKKYDEINGEGAMERAFQLVYDRSEGA